VLSEIGRPPNGFLAITSTGLTVIGDVALTYRSTVSLPAVKPPDCTSPDLVVHSRPIY
jgi:hypothetical protein